MARQQKSKKQQVSRQASRQASRQTPRQASRNNASQASSQGGQQKKSQTTARKAFTVIICVVVALGLMLPVTGLGVASCSTPPPEQTTQP